MQVPYQTKTEQSRLVLILKQRHNKTMNMNDYQAKARKTAIYPDQGQNFIYPVLGLVGETGEVAEKIKKIIRDEGGQLTPTKVADIKKELGDVMWYLAQLSTELGLSLEEIAQGNLEKLASRHKQNMIHGDGDNREEGR
jgi:NTP pyrophosphatase (non-canonical NTP hydrolase)